MLIGLLEDDMAQANLLITWLETDGHQVIHSSAGDDFLKSYSNHAFDLAILDWQVPNKNGLEVLEDLRKKYDCQIPILFSTQRNAEKDIVTALQYGADDYVTKPVRQAELLARISALGRRAGVADTAQELSFGPFNIDTTEETISVSGTPVKLTKKDYQVALCLFSNIGKVLSREFLLKQIWGVNSELDTRTVDVHVSRVRRTLKIGPERGFVIKTIYMHGYRLEHLDN